MVVTKWDNLYIGIVLNTSKCSLTVGYNYCLDVGRNKMSKSQFLPPGCSKEPSGVGEEHNRKHYVFNKSAAKRSMWFHVNQSGKQSSVLEDGWGRARKAPEKNALWTVFWKMSRTSHMVETANAKAQNYVSMALWGPEVACCLWKSDAG